MGKLVIDGNSVYEIDEECIRRKENRDSRQGENQDSRQGDNEDRYGRQVSHGNLQRH